MLDRTVPQPGPAKLRRNAGPDEWLAAARECKYLSEHHMKQLCEMVKEYMMEGLFPYLNPLNISLYGPKADSISIESNIQPVATPVTICGDIHGQFYDLLELFRVAGGMPNEENVQAPIAPIPVITSNDIEPPSIIRNPKLRKKYKNADGFTDSSDDETASISDRELSESASSREVNTIPPGNFVFLGDYVDRGYFSLETLTLLLCLKAKYVAPRWTWSLYIL